MGLPATAASAVGHREFDENNQLQTPKKQTDDDPEVWITAPSARWPQEPCQGEKTISHPEFPLCSGPCSLWTSSVSRSFRAPATRSLVFSLLKEAFPRLGFEDRESGQRRGFLVPAWVTRGWRKHAAVCIWAWNAASSSGDTHKNPGTLAGAEQEVDYKQGRPVWGKPSGHLSPRQETTSKLLGNWMLACFHIKLLPRLEHMVANVSCQTQPPYGSNKSIHVRVRPVWLWILGLSLWNFGQLLWPLWASVSTSLRFSETSKEITFSVHVAQYLARSRHSINVVSSLPSLLSRPFGTNFSYYPFVNTLTDPWFNVSFLALGKASRYNPLPFFPEWIAISPPQLD